MFLEQPEGKYVIVKDPNKPIVRIYSVPLETFEEQPAEHVLPQLEPYLPTGQAEIYSLDFIY